MLLIFIVNLFVYLKLDSWFQRGWAYDCPMEETKKGNLAYLESLA